MTDEPDIPLTMNFGKRIGKVTKLTKNKDGDIEFEATIDMRELSEEQADAIFGDVKHYSMTIEDINEIQ